jgi:hypothetical protein
VKHRGHPIRGAIAGLFFGLFVSLDLVIFGVLALDADLLALFPLLGLLGGIALGITAPLTRGLAKGDPAEPTKAEPAELESRQPAPAMATAEPDPSKV